MGFCDQLERAIIYVEDILLRSEKKAVRQNSFILIAREHHPQCLLQNLRKNRPMLVRLHNATNGSNQQVKFVRSSEDGKISKEIGY